MSDHYLYLCEEEKMAEMICSLCNAKMEYDSFTSAYVCQVCGHSVSAKNAEAEAPASESVSASAPATSPASAFAPELSSSLDTAFASEPDPFGFSTQTDEFSFESSAFDIPSLTEDISLEPAPTPVPVETLAQTVSPEPAPAEAPAPIEEPAPAPAPTPAQAEAPAPAIDPTRVEDTAPAPAPDPVPTPIPVLVQPSYKAAENSEGAELIRQVKASMADQKYENAAEFLSVLNKRKIQFASLYPQTFLLTLLCGYQVNSLGELFAKIGKNGYALKKLVERPGWMEFTKALELEDRELFPDIFEYSVICCAFSGEADQILGKKNTPTTARVHIPDSSGDRKNAFEVALATTMTRLAGGEDLVPRSMELFKRIKTIEKAILA